MDKQQNPAAEQPNLVDLMRINTPLWLAIRDYLESLPWDVSHHLLVAMFDDKMAEDGTPPNYSKEGLELIINFLKKRPRVEVKDIMRRFSMEDAVTIYKFDPQDHSPEAQEDVSETPEGSGEGEGTVKPLNSREAKEKAKKTTAQKK